MVARPDTLENGLTVFLQRVTRDGLLSVGFEPIEPVGRLAAKKRPLLAALWSMHVHVRGLHYARSSLLTTCRFFGANGRFDKKRGRHDKGLH